MSAGAIASVSGILIEKQVPWPSVEESEMEPPIASIFSRTTSMPTAAGNARRRRRKARRKD
jgi:hypothetical protein